MNQARKIMAFFILTVITELWETLLERRPLLVYAATWTTFVAATVAAASVAPEVAFVWALTSSPYAGGCGGAAIRILLDAPPGEIICVPAELFGHTGVDFLVPTVLAAAVVAAAAYVVRVVGLWEAEDNSS
ncbi:hypothetical protein KFK09_001017 [Dendrobium nobile]|uniref:Uncharacterized protein n=1 Tax=Dendrobium nobile TaxID=94219 RepID=A0A8T3CDF4_DENNO|nr:hypothetical protein KFK09_001017 [Dendrobium nobile]